MFYVNGLTYPRVPGTLSCVFQGLVGEVSDQVADISPNIVHKQVSELIATRLNVLLHVREALTESQYIQKEQAGDKGR